MNIDDNYLNSQNLASASSHSVVVFPENHQQVLQVLRVLIEHVPEVQGFVRSSRDSSS